MLFLRRYSQAYAHKAKDTLSYVKMMNFKSLNFFLVLSHFSSLEIYLCQMFQRAVYSLCYKHSHVLYIQGGLLAQKKKSQIAQEALQFTNIIPDLLYFTRYLTFSPFPLYVFVRSLQLTFIISDTFCVLQRDLSMQG